MRVIKNSKEKIKKIFKSRAFIFVTTALVFSTIGVSAATYFPSNDVTYDNKESGLKSTDVQGRLMSYMDYAQLRHQLVMQF